jgi:hypothetical protein
MKLSHLALTLAAFAMAPSAFAASVLTVVNDGKSLDNVAVSKSGTLLVEGRTSQLVTMGAGIRTATLGIHAYEGEVLVDNKDKYDCRGASLASLKDQKAVVIRINVLFSFGKSKLVEALESGFEANDVDAEDADVRAVLAKIQAGPDAPRGAVILFAGEKLPDGTEALTYENQGKAVTVKGKAGLVKNIMSLWLGKTDDSGLKNLNKNLTNCLIQ